MIKELRILAAKIQHHYISKHASQDMPTVLQGVQKHEKRKMNKKKICTSV